jgi:hypothetical protein
VSDYWQQQRYEDAVFAQHGVLLGLTPARVLATGSRRLTDAALVEDALAFAKAEFSPRPIVVVHGGAAGADELAHVLAPTFAMTTGRWPADWTGPCRSACKPGHRRQRRDGTGYCPAAGNYRNQAMVDAGAELVLAFPVGASTGTRDCMRRAKAAGIPARVYEQAVAR